jgi:predicted nucleic acid-binding protein
MLQQRESMPRPVVLEAVRGALTYQMSYRDAQIWASAKMNQVPVVFSEDFGEGKTIEGVRFVNPFDSNFNIEVWLPGSRKT